jgi:hypothetical protein
MNDYERENMVAWGRTAAMYMNKDAGLLEVLAIDSYIEGEHTRYVVGQRTGDYRLARKAGNSAIMLYWWRAFLILGIPAAAYAAGAGLIYISTGPGRDRAILATLWVIPCVVLLFYVAVKTDSVRNGAFIRANLPSERTLNKSGYYEVEPNVWFNMVTNRVLEGACYRPAEQVVRRSTVRNEDKAIRAMYRNRGEYRGSFKPTGLRSWYVDKLAQGSMDDVA